jgi:hypothetical protein
MGLLGDQISSALLREMTAQIISEIKIFRL